MDFEIGTVGCGQIRPKTDRNSINPTEIRPMLTLKIVRND